MKTRRIVIWDIRVPSIEDRMEDIAAIAPGWRIETYDSEEDLEANIEGAEIAASLTLSNQALARSGSLRWYHTWSAGVDGLMSPELADGDFIYTSSKGNGGVTMAEWAMLMMLAWSKQAAHYLEAHKQKTWAPLQHGELNGCTAGIIGLGNSGADLARKCQAFNMKVLGMRRTSAPCDYVDEMFTFDRLHEMLAQSDYVVVTAPLTDETRGMIGETEFRAMKPGAYFIVTSRGGIAREDALLKALSKGWIAGAAIDVHEVEPLTPDSPLWTAPGALVTPHCASIGNLQAARAAEIFIDNLRRYVSGEPLRNVVDRQAGY